jgi:hypothetical protein
VDVALTETEARKTIALVAYDVLLRSLILWAGIKGARC